MLARPTVRSGLSPATASPLHLPCIVSHALRSATRRNSTEPVASSGGRSSSDPRQADRPAQPKRVHSECLRPRQRGLVGCHGQAPHADSGAEHESPLQSSALAKSDCSWLEPYRLQRIRQRQIGAVALVQTASLSRIMQTQPRIKPSIIQGDQLLNCAGA